MMLWALLTMLAFLTRVSVQQCTIHNFKEDAIDKINSTETSEIITIPRTYYNCLSRSNTSDHYSSMSVSILYSRGRNRRFEVRYNLQCNNRTWEIVGNQSTALRSNTSYDCSDCTDQTVNDYHCTNISRPNVNLVRSFSSVILLEGEMVTLSCIPIIRRTVLWWTHNGSIVMDGTTFPRPNSARYLPITNATTSDSGLYTCRDAMDNPLFQQNISVTVLPEFIYRQYYGNGIWGSPVSECQTMEIKALLMKARGLGHIVQKINVNRGRDIANFFRYRFVQDIVNQLLEVVNASHTILPMDLQCIATILRNIRMETRQIINSTNIDDRSQVARTIIEPIIMVLDHVLDERNDESFELVRKMIQKGILTLGERFQAITERIGILLSRTQRTTADYTVMNNMSYKNIAVLAQIPTEQDLMGLGSIEFSGFLNRTMRASMRIPKQAILNQTGRTGRRRPVINIINRNVHLPTQEGERIASFVLSGKISTDFDVQTSLGDSQAAMSFSIENVTNILSSNPRCFFFRFTRDNVTSGRFSSDGITSSNFTNKTFVECSTTHLTSFAVLVDVSGEDTHSQNHEALSVVSYIGCAISIVCLLVAACLFIVLRKKVFIQEHHFLHLNLSIALLLGLTAFVSGIETASEYRASCLIVAILLHYFFMATFSWMLCEGILLFTMMKFVFYKGFFKSKVFFLLLGWGMPIPIVAVSAAVSHHQYGYEDKCWISEENGAIWAFIGPILLIIMMNSAVLIVTIYEIYKSNHNSLNTTQMNYKNTIKSLLRAAVIIVPLLGVTWVVGILAVNENTVVFAWIFTILNSLQGMFILILYVLRNEKFLLLCRQKLTQGFHSNVTSVKGVTIKGAEAISKILSVETKSIALDVTSNKETLSPVSNSYSQATDKSKETFV